MEVAILKPETRLLQRKEKGDFQKKRCRKKHIAIHTQIVSVCAEVGLEVKLFTSNKPHIQFE